MKISENWLRTWVNPSISTDELVSLLTMAGLEVGATENIGDELAGIVVGLIEKAEPHPEADKLQVCSVNVGIGENLQIICGAPNVRQGLKVAVATIGCILPGDYKIKKTKLRGIHSFGMLCSAKELQISDENNGIMELSENAVIGASLVDTFGLKDTVIDIDLTPNRGDCLSVKGIATEVGVLTQTALRPVAIQTAPVLIEDKVDIKLSVPEANPKFVSRVIRQINMNAQTPEWMRTRLQAADVRCIDPVVDVTNYVMLELGHPMHAFDRNKIEGALEIRYAKKGESLVLLDEQKIQLRSDTVVVADDKKPLSIAGIMGGKYSSISAETTDLLLEVAHWDPVHIAGKARSYGMHTDASHRFERGVDYHLCVDAMERATELLLTIVGGKAGPIVDKKSEAHFPRACSVQLRRHRIERLLGVTMPDEQIEDILSRLQMKLTKNSDGWCVAVPSSRFDITIEADLIEELVRVYGYNKVSGRKPIGELSMIRRPENRLLKQQVARLLADRGYQEALTYSFVDERSQQLVDPKVRPLPLVNPISSELAVMRTSLWPGLLKTVEYNQKRQHDQVRLFEMGLKFVADADYLLRSMASPKESQLSMEERTPKTTGLQQLPVIAGVISGRRYCENWEAANELVDFYDLKGDLEAIFRLTGAEDDFSFVKARHDALHPGQTAEIVRNGRVCGVIGKLHPQVRSAFDLEGPVFAFELLLTPLLKRKLPAFKSVSKFPAIRRDLAFLVKESVTSSQIVDLIGQSAKHWLNNIVIFDIYRGKGVEPGYKSVAVGFNLERSDRTFKEAEVTKTVDRIISTLTKELNAVLRD